MEREKVSFIREEMKRKNLTQEDLVKKLFVISKTIYKWDTGKGITDISLMNPLRDLLDVTL